jgi:hypothetical protein
MQREGRRPLRKTIAITNSNTAASINININTNTNTNTSNKSIYSKSTNIIIYKQALPTLNHYQSQNMVVEVVEVVAGE